MVCEEPWPCKNPPIRVGVGHTYFKVNVQYLVPITTTERDDGDSAHAARPILATSGAIVIVTGPDLDGDNQYVGEIATVQTGDGETANLITDRGLEIRVARTSICRSSRSDVY
jgi:hypothetical protein